MKVLVIDSHKSSSNKPAQNLHWLNARTIANSVGGDLIWSYPEVNDSIVKNYDVIVFVHASHYAYTDYKWLEESPNAKLFYVSNEYNLGEPRTLWMAAKEGRKYTVIANHPPEPSKIVMKYVDDWKIVNLNAISYNYNWQEKSADDFTFPRNGIIYYGSYRKGREQYFKKYLGGNITTSTHSKNHAKFLNLGIKPRFVPRLNWCGRGLLDFKHSLYIEDEITHKHYNFLANRFYESLNCGCVPIFDESCMSTIEKSKYSVPSSYIISGAEELNEELPQDIVGSWLDIASEERKQSIISIKRVIFRSIDAVNKASP